MGEANVRGAGRGARHDPSVFRMLLLHHFDFDSGPDIDLDDYNRA